MNRNLGIALSLVVVVIIGVFMYFGYSNAEIDLRNHGKAQQSVVKVVFDNTWKIIQQQAGVADQYRETFERVYPQLMEARYDNAKDLLAQFVTESNPNFDTRLFEKLMVSIEAQRTVFTREQKTLIDIKREHDNIRQKAPGSWFVGSRPEMTIQIVTSSKTEEVFGTGKEDDVDLFKKEAKPSGRGR